MRLNGLEGLLRGKTIRRREKEINHDEIFILDPFIDTDIRDDEL